MLHPLGPHFFKNVDGLTGSTKLIYIKSLYATRMPPTQNILSVHLRSASSSRDAILSTLLYRDTLGGSPPPTPPPGTHPHPTPTHPPHPTPPHPPQGPKGGGKGPKGAFGALGGNGAHGTLWGHSVAIPNGKPISNGTQRFRVDGRLPSGQFARLRRPYEILVLQVAFWSLKGGLFKDLGAPEIQNALAILGFKPFWTPGILALSDNGAKFNQKKSKIGLRRTDTVRTMTPRWAFSHTQFKTHRGVRLKRPKTRRRGVV